MISTRLIHPDSYPLEWQFHLWQSPDNPQNLFASDLSRAYPVTHWVIPNSGYSSPEA